MPLDTPVLAMAFLLDDAEAMFEQDESCRLRLKTALVLLIRMLRVEGKGEMARTSG